MKSEDFEAKLSVWIAPADKDKTGSLGSRGSSLDSARGRHGPASGMNSDDGLGPKRDYLTIHTSAKRDQRQDTNPNIKTKETTSKYSKHSYSSDEEEGSREGTNSREHTSNKMQQTWGQKRDSDDHIGYKGSKNKQSVEKEGTSTKPNESSHSLQIDESWNRGRSAEPTANSTQKESLSNIKTKGVSQDGELRYQVRKLQAESVDQQETIQRLEDENYELRSELFESKDALANLEIEVANLRSQGARNGTKPTNYTENSYGDDRDMSLYTSEIGDLKKTLASKNALLKLQTEEMTSMGKRVEMLSQEVAKLNVMLSQSEEDKQKILEETAQVAKKEIDMLRGHLEDLQCGLEAAVKRAEKSEHGWNESETKLRMVRDEYERFKAESKNMADRLDEQHQQTLISLRKELEDSRRQVERREADAIRRERDSAARDRERDLQALQSKLELEIKERDREIEMLKAEVQAGRDRIEQEVQKLHSLSSQQVELLRAENKELDRRVMDEIRKRHSSEERLRAKERAERDTAFLSRGDHHSSGTPSRPKSSSRKQSGTIRHGSQMDLPGQPPGNNLVTELEKQLSSKTHEVIDLTSVNNNLSRRLAAAEHEQQQATRRATLLDQELGFLKEKHTALTDKMKYLQTAESIQQKTEFEVLKELNDLREAVQKLKEERDKILRVLGTENFHSPKLFAEVSTEVFLGMVEKLTTEKKQLGVEFGFPSFTLIVISICFPDSVFGE